MNDQQTQMMINQAQHIMNQAPPPPQVMNQQPPPPLPQLPVQSQPMMMLNRSYNTNINNNNTNSSINNNNKPWPGKIGNFGSSKPRTNNNNNNNNNNWKGKKITIDKRRIDNQIANAVYNPPTLHELQSQNRQKTRKFYSNKKKFNNNNNNNRFAPYAPRNTTSFIIRAKKAGGIASLVSPCPVTPAVLPTPIFSPSREVLGDMAKEEWGVDGYGSMKGLIRLRSGNDHDEEDDDEGNGSSESDVEEHVEVERRLDHDLSRFEMIYPNYSNNIGGLDYNNVLENRVDDQDSHISQLEEENLTLKERLFLMERELGDLRRRMQFLERQNSNQHQSCLGVEDVHEEVVENGSENESENGFDVREHREENNEDVCMQASGVPVKKEEEIVRNEFGDDSLLAERDDRRNIEEVDNQMVAEVKSEDEQKEAANEIIENKVNLVAEKEESKDEHMCVEKSIDGVDKL